MEITEQEVSKRIPHWQRKKEQRPVDIIQAARKLFVSQGFAATKIADIAKEAGVQAGTIYVYFENKETLFKAVIETSVQPLLNVANDIVDRYQGTPAELIRVLVDKWWELLESETCKGIPKLISSESQNFPKLAEFYTKECIIPARAMIYRILQYALSKNQIQLLNMELASRVIFHLLHQIVIYANTFSKYETNPISTKTVLNATADFIIRSVLKLPDESSETNE